MNRLLLWLDNPILVKHCRSRLRQMHLFPALGIVMVLDYWYVMSQIGENKQLKLENRKLRQQVQIFKNKMTTIESSSPMKGSVHGQRSAAPSRPAAWAGVERPASTATMAARIRVDEGLNAPRPNCRRRGHRPPTAPTARPPAAAPPPSPA